MPGVPQRIVVGPTTYVHFRHRHRDYYAPDFLFTPNANGDSARHLTPPSPEDCAHVWRYTVSREHHNTVFFSNAVTRASVWVLPIVHRDGRTEPLGEGEAMRVVDDSDAEDDVEAAAEPRASATPQEAGGNHTDTAHSKHDLNGRKSSTSPRPAAEASSAPAGEHDAPSKARVQAAVQRALEAESQRTALTLSASAPSRSSSSSSPQPTLQDRLAAWRARQRGENVEPTAVPLEAATAHVAGNASPSTASPQNAAARASSPSPPPAAADDARSCVVSPTSHKAKSPSPSTQPPARSSPSRATSTPPQQQHDHSGRRTREVTPPSTPPRVMASPQERELARATALLHREKVAAMQQERAALECRRRALAVEEAEAQERVRLAEARAAAERTRLQEAERAAHAQAAQRAALEAAAVSRSRTEEVNAYLAQQQALESAAETAVADSFTYATRIAAQLAAAAPRPEHVQAAVLPNRPSATAQRRDGEEAEAEENGPAPRFRLHRVGSITTHVEGPLLRPAGTGGTAPSAPQRVPARIAYAAPHVYEGEVLTYRPSRLFQRQDRATLNGSRVSAAASATTAHAGSMLTTSGPVPPLVLAAKRDGAGTQYYDAARAHYFRGTWLEDRRDGAGVLSLPSTAVQGRWRADQLRGPGVLQTRHSKGTVTFVSGAHTHRAGGVAVRGEPHTPAGLHHRGGIPATAISARDAVAADTTTVTGDAVVELDTRALFVGALQEGRVRAPYVLQLGQGDYIEWLGGTASSAAGGSGGGGGRGGGGGGGGVAAQLVTRTPPRRRAGTAASPSSSSFSSSPAQPGTGECRIRFRNDDTYVGHVRDFRLHGFGYYRFAEDGHSYTGRFEGGLPHGEGLLICANGDVYRGGFRQGLFEGHGAYASKAGGYVYEGDWAAGEMEGAGSIAFANGDVWQGTFKNSERVAGSYTTLA